MYLPCAIIAATSPPKPQPSSLQRMRKQRAAQENELAEKIAARKAIEEASADVVAHLKDGEELKGRPTTSDMRALMPRPDTAPAVTIEDQVRQEFKTNEDRK